MKIENYEGGKIVFFQSLFDEAKAAQEREIANLDIHFEQYKGSNVIDGSSEEAGYVRNVTYEMIESQVTTYVPTPVVDAKAYSEKNVRNAMSIQTLCRSKRNELSFEVMNDIDERYTYIYGGSVWLVEWDNSISTHSTVGDVRVSVINPKNFIGQPGIYDVNDMEYCFVIFETTKEDIVRRYGVKPEIAEETQSDDNAIYDRTATLYVCYYKNEEDKICQYVWSGDVELLDIDDYYARKKKTCRLCGKRKEICTCENAKASDYESESEDFEELTRPVALSDGSEIPAMSPKYENGEPVFDKVDSGVVGGDGTVQFTALGGGVMLPNMTSELMPVTERTRLPYYYPKKFPIVIRKNTSSENSVLGQSDCEFLRPVQQAINKVESRLIEKLVRAGVYPIMPEGASITLNNSVFGTILRVKPGEAGSYGSLDMAVDISKDVHEAERLYDQAKRLMGISDSFLGQYDASAKSGKAKEIQVQQAAGRLSSKRAMKNAAYADIDRIIFEYYLAYADEPRPISYKDAFGRVQELRFNRYDFIERDEAGEYYYNDEYLFSADSSAYTEQNREYMWELNLNNLQNGSYGDPKDPTTLLRYWQNMERAHYPHARDNVEYFKEQVEKLRQMEEMQARLAAAEEEINSRKRYEEELMRGFEGELAGRMGYEKYLKEASVSSEKG